MTSPNDSELCRLMMTARMGFKMVPFLGYFRDKGVCTFYLDGDGIRVTNSAGFEESITWAEFDLL